MSAVAVQTSVIMLEIVDLFIQQYFQLFILKNITLQDG